MDKFAKEYVEGNEEVKIEIEAQIKSEEIEQFLALVIENEPNAAKKSQLERKLTEKVVLRKLREDYFELKTKLRGLEKNSNKINEIENIKAELDNIKKSTSESTQVDGEKVRENLAASNRVSEKLAEVTTGFADKKCDTEVVKNYKLSSQTPIFKGSSEDDVERWLYGVEADMNLIHMPHNMTVFLFC
jgi:hypothetical protein